jgi:hypothetical protein
LVFGTLHTTTAPSTVDRIIDQFPAERQAQIRTMLASSLKGVVAQTLCKKVPKGRVAALEILIANNAVSANIREGKVHQIPSAMQMGGKLGMRLMNDSLIEHVRNGAVEPLEAYMKAVNKEDMLAKFKQANVPFDVSKLGDEHDASPAPAAHAPAHGGMPVRPTMATSPTRAPLPTSRPASEPSSLSLRGAPKPEPEPESGGITNPFARFRKKT